MDDLVAISAFAFFFGAVAWQLLTGVSLPVNRGRAYLRYREPGPYWRSIVGQCLLTVGCLAGFVLVKLDKDLQDRWESQYPQASSVPEAGDGMARAATEDPGDPLGSLRSAVERAPADFEAHRRLDHALARQGRWDEILEMWNRFLARHPTHADAYYERGGTHYRKGDVAAARADATRACELGKREACERVERLEPRS